MLRDYQKDAVASIYDYFIAGKTGNPLIAMPTGSGKSLVIAEFIKSAMQNYAGQRIVILCHVKELLEQNLAQLLRLWPTAPAGLYSAGLKRKDIHLPIIFAGIASIAKKFIQLGKVDLVIVDEAHTVSPKGSTLYRTFFAELKRINPDLRIIGFTATPYRLNNGHLIEAGLFTDVCYDNTTFSKFTKLIAEGYLAPLVIKKPDFEYDVSSVKIKNNEYDAHALQELVDKTDSSAKAIDEIMQQSAQRYKILVFCAGVKHAAHVCAQLNARGLTAFAIDASTPSEQRAEYIAGFRSGAVQVLLNTNVLTTGFDVPDVDLIAVLRPTLSTSLWVQMLGRGTRPAPGKINCLVLDFAGNTKRLGPINAPFIPQARGKSKGGGMAPVRVCPACMTYNHARALACVACMEIFPANSKLLQEASTADVMVLDKPTKVELCKVDKVAYSKHVSTKNGISTLCVAYHCGLTRVKDYVCFEHTGKARWLAEKWWHVAASAGVSPLSVDEALARSGEIRAPLKIKVCFDKIYPQLLETLYE
jgi:DNA repair protein RadD